VYFISEESFLFIVARVFHDAGRRAINKVFTLLTEEWDKRGKEGGGQASLDDVAVAKQGKQ